MTPKELAQACELAFNSVEQLTKEAKEREKGSKTMSEKKHTPGPWELERCDDYDGNDQLVITSNNRPGYVAGIHCAEEGAIDEVDQANARLIAAAPELLEACKKVAAMLSDGCAEDTLCLGAVSILNGSIAKAEGRS